MFQSQSFSPNPIRPDLVPYTPQSTTPPSVSCHLQGSALPPWLAYRLSQLVPPGSFLHSSYHRLRQNLASSRRSQAAAVSVLAIVILFIIVALLRSRPPADTRPIEERENWRTEANRACLRKKEWRRPLCWRTEGIVWHVRQFEIWKVVAWEAATTAAADAAADSETASGTGGGGSGETGGESATAGSASTAVAGSAVAGVLPSSAVTVPMSQIDLGILKSPALAAKWTAGTKPAPDGLLHVLVDQFPCAAHGCCAIHWQLRPNSTDLLSLGNHFVRFEYSALLKIPIEPRYILDAGGTGMAALAFALLYPDALVVRVEPEAENFRVGVVSSARVGNIVHVRAALWDRIAPLSLCESQSELPGDADWPFANSSRQLGFVTEEGGESGGGGGGGGGAGSGKKKRVKESKRTRYQESLVGAGPTCEGRVRGHVQGSTLTAIMAAYGIPRFDLVKMDIEGAERRVFAHKPSLRVLRGVQVFIGELHEGGGVCEGCKGTVLRNFERWGGFKKFVDGRNVLMLSRDLFSC
ncbi:unnamed protein product [Closterium sp. NIES-65]|nr:unnamed protein product [Closterium sp. NIES-65]